jgi:mannitol-1-phosphate 5-dehydrogenase
MVKSAVVFGAGNVGRGFLGQLLSESGYELVFVDVDRSLITALNNQRGYTIRLVEDDWAEEVFVSPVGAIHAGEVQGVTRALSDASLAATAVGVRALPHIAPSVANSIASRAEAGIGAPLNVIVCENMKNAGATFRDMVLEHLPAAHQSYMQEHVGFVDTVIARMVPPPTPDMRARDPSLIVVEPYKELPVDRLGFVGPVPDVVGLEPVDDFDFYMARKLYLHNCGHAMLGYLGHLRGHIWGHQALQDPVVRSLLDRALSESQAGIVAAYAVELAPLEAHIAEILRRFANHALGDTVFRLARDPLRKLAPEDRLVGAARLAERAGVVPDALSWGIAAGYSFDHPDDPLAICLQERIGAEGLAAVLASVSAIAAGELLATLVQERFDRLQREDWP